MMIKATKLAFTFCWCKAKEIILLVFTVLLSAIAVIVCYFESESPGDFIMFMIVISLFTFLFELVSANLGQTKFSKSVRYADKAQTWGMLFMMAAISFKTLIINLLAAAVMFALKGEAVIFAYAFIGTAPLFFPFLPLAFILYKFSTATMIVYFFVCCSAGFAGGIADAWVESVADLADNVPLNNMLPLIGIACVVLGFAVSALFVPLVKKAEGSNAPLFRGGTVNKL